MLDTLRREGIYLWYYFSLQLEQIFRYWAIGIVIGSVISVFGKARIHQLFSAMGKKKLGVLGIVAASAIGVISPLCMYGTIPIAASFSEKGIRDDWLAAFMMSSILLNPQLIIYSAALGRTALIIRIVSCLLCGIAAGLLIRLFYRDKPFFNFSGFAEPTNRDTDPNPVLRLLKNIWRNVKVTGPYFLLGIALSALFQRYVPQDIVTRLFGGQRGFGVLMAATIGVPLYACGGGTIPLLQGWMANGMSMGSATAFMITGPSTKITNLGAVKIVLGAKRFALYIIFAMAFAFLSGVLVDVVM
ncbi:MAG: permease [Oscillospiraceae bacterium]